MDMDMDMDMVTVMAKQRRINLEGEKGEEK